MVSHQGWGGGPRLRQPVNDDPRLGPGWPEGLTGGPCTIRDAGLWGGFWQTLVCSLLLDPWTCVRAPVRRPPGAVWLWLSNCTPKCALGPCACAPRQGEWLVPVAVATQCGSVSMPSALRGGGDWAVARAPRARRPLLALLHSGKAPEPSLEQKNQC